MNLKFQWCSNGVPEFQCQHSPLHMGKLYFKHRPFIITQAFFFNIVTSPSGHSSASSTQNNVIDVDRGFFVSWVKAGSRLVLHHRKSGNLYASKASKHPLATQFIIIPLHPVKKSDAAIGKPDPYVRVFHSGNNKDIIAQTKVIDNDLSPVWNEVHYSPIRCIGDKFILDVMDFNTFVKDKPLGNCTLDITGELVKEVSEGCYEGTSNGIDIWAKLTIQGQIYYKAKFFPLEPLPKPTPDFLANLKEKPFDRAAFYVLITLQAPNELDEAVRNLDHKIWATVLVTFFLKVLLWKHRREWVNIYNRAESWLSENVIDFEVEERLYNYANKFVIKHFKITHRVDENQQRSLGLLVTCKRTIITRRYVDTRIVRRTGQLKANAWSTAIMLWFIRYVLVDFRNDWVNEYQKAHDWICQQVPDDKVREELLEAARNFIVKRFEVQNDAINEDESFKESIEVKDRFQSQGQDIREIVNEPDPEEEAPIPNDEVVGIIRILVKDAKNLKKSDSWFTFSNPDPYVRIVDSARNEIVRTHVDYGTINPKWNEVHLISAHSLGENISFEIYDENIFKADQPCGTYVLDTNILLKSEDQSKPTVGQFPLQIGKKPIRGHLNLEVQFFATGFNEGENFIFSKDTIKQQHLYMFISWRNANGSFEFTDKLARFFNYKSVDELKENFLAHLSSDKDDFPEDFSIDILVTYKKKAFLVQCKSQIDPISISVIQQLNANVYSFDEMMTYILLYDSETWLSKEINIVDAEDRLYNLCKTFIIERFKVKNLEKEQLEIIEPANVTIINRKVNTIWHVRTLLSHQSDDGCVVLNEKVAEYFGFKSVDECLQHLRKHFKTERVSKLHQNAWTTACVVCFVAAIKTKEVAIEEEKNELKRQKKGSMHRKTILLSGTVVNRSTTTEPIVKKFFTYHTNDETWYLRLVAVDHRPHWAMDCDTSYKWLSSKIKNPQIERELLGSAKKFVVRGYNVGDDALEKDEE
ncbi:membrane bound c2 domain-containing protein [Gigaspora margarita]|uniref:Membrane bound c2 domain-containing protein n=1 Tax=Gigaspora margarita TaxID=4874 RepID=A0A8H3X806_GIGMA|nr:membrane bound c2 domain-containing protein [Gigaspora margarita]